MCSRTPYQEPLTRSHRQKLLFSSLFGHFVKTEKTSQSA
jgi:hypothetical protein